MGAIYILTAFLALIDDNEDKERFKNLYMKYRGLMAKVAGEKVSAKEDIEDVLQDTFFYIAKNFHKIDDVDSQRTKNFICVITEGFAISKFRKEKKYMNTLPLDDAIDINSLNDDFDLFDIADLEMALDLLSDEHRNMMYLTYAFGYTSKEIAFIYGITDANVRKRIQFAKMNLRNKLDGDE